MQIDIPPTLIASVTVALRDRAAQLQNVVDDETQRFEYAQSLGLSTVGQAIGVGKLRDEVAALLAFAVQVQSVPTPAASQRQTSDNTVTAAAHCRERLLAIESSQSPEFQHLTADAALCQLLSALGYTEIVVLWRKVDKWYA